MRHERINAFEMDVATDVARPIFSRSAIIGTGSDSCKGNDGGGSFVSDETFLSRGEHVFCMSRAVARIFFSTCIVELEGVAFIPNHKSRFTARLDGCNNKRICVKAHRKLGNINGPK